MERGRPGAITASGAIGTGCTPPSLLIRNECGLQKQRRDTGNGIGEKISLLQKGGAH